MAIIAREGTAVGRGASNSAVDLRRPFRGSRAVADGVLTPGALRGPRFRRLFPDVYVAAGVVIDLALMSRAAYLLVEGTGVLGGYSAAELLGASCGSEDAPAEVVSPIRTRSRPGLLVREGVVPVDERWRVGEVLVTSPLHTAFRLGCRLPLVEAVVAVDALTHRFELDPWEVIRFGYRYPGAAGTGRLPEVVRLADPLSDSPMETRIRVAVRLAGLPVPVLQHPVGPYLLDLAYPAVLLAVEYDGREHLTPARARRDLVRQAHLTAAGWTVLRFSAHEVLHRPWAVVAAVRRALVERGVIGTCRTPVLGRQH